MRHLKYGFLAVVFLTMTASGAWAWSNSGNCLDCHQDFGGFGETSHDAHNTFIEDCGYCHSTANQSDTPDTDGSLNDGSYSCNGCHNAAGLRVFHQREVSENCGCHASDPIPLESDVPHFYNDLAVTTLNTPCWDGLDNDGDSFYDTTDTDCDGVPNDDTSWSVIKQIYGD